MGVCEHVKRQQRAEQREPPATSERQRLNLLLLRGAAPPRARFLSMARGVPPDSRRSAPTVPPLALYTTDKFKLGGVFF